MTARERLQVPLARMWTASPPLTAVGLLMLAILVPSLLGVLFDPRLITGMPAWLKPAKFAASIAIYTLTLAWVFTQLPEWPSLRRLVGWLSAGVVVREVASIDTQAWRGTTSHFNVGTPLDRILFGIMGLAIAVQTLSTIAVATALWRHRFSDPALGWALRLGMVMTIVGAAAGGMMSRPTSAQLDEARTTGLMAVAGAHTVGAPDGGPGLPGTGWSTEHGDLRVAHFVGLHALQTLPAVALLLPRRRIDDRRRARAVVVAAGSYAALFAILLWQALRGQSVFAPDVTTAIVMAGWILVTLGAVGGVLVSRRPAAFPAAIRG